MSTTPVESGVDRLLATGGTDGGWQRKSKRSNQSPCTGLVSVVDGFNWLKLTSDVWSDWDQLELTSWLEEYINYVNRKDAEDTAYRIAKKCLKINISWKQPSFLRVPKHYEQILEVMMVPLNLEMIYSVGYLPYLY